MKNTEKTTEVARNFVTGFVLDVACAYGLDEDETFDLLWDHEPIIASMNTYDTKGLTRSMVDVGSAFGVAAILGRSLTASNIGQTGVITPVMWATLFCRRCAELLNICDQDLLYLLIQVTDVLERHASNKKIGIVPTGIAEQLRAVV
jgi:hypothetical protein